ncbi:MAG: glycosyltransferase family 39 protein [Thermomicrobiales bacterium]
MRSSEAATIDRPMVAHLAVSRTFVIDLCLVLGLFAITLWRLLPAVDSTPFHRDEARWIGNSALLREWRHPLGIRWQDEGYPDLYGTLDERNRRRSQPPLAMYYIGAGLLLQGHDLPGTGYWIMDKGPKWNTAHGNMPASGDVRAARRTSIFAAGLTVIALFLIGSGLTNRVGGVATALIYAVHPLVLDVSTRAWSDPLLVFCIALAALAAGRLAARPTWASAALAGLFLGLGGATKLSPLAIAGGLGGLGIAMVAWSFLGPGASAGHLRRLGVRLVAVPPIASLVFVAVYPYLWKDPIAHTRWMLDFRTESFRLQALSFPPAKVSSRTDAFRRVGRELGDRFSAGGLIAKNLAHHLGTGDWTWLHDLDLLLASAGWIVIAAIAIRRGTANPPILIAAVIGGQALFIVLAMGVEYARYLMPVLLAVAVGAGAIFGVGWEIVAHATMPRRRAGSDSSPLRQRSHAAEAEHAPCSP